MVNGDIRDPARALNKDVVAKYAKTGVGSILNAPFNGHVTDGRTGWSAAEWKQVIAQIQEIYKQHNQIPMIYGIDTIHGATYVRGATLFGQPISAASSFNLDLVFQMGEIEAKDTLAAGIPWVFSPVLGIAVQPRWPRVFETFGEDPYVSSRMGASIIRGIQSTGRVAACMKHFIGYSNPTSGLDRADNVISDWDLVNHFAPSFLAATREGGVKTAMESYISINGEPVIASHRLLTTLLRHDMNFTGMLVSDYSEIDRMHSEHRLVPSVADAVRVSLAETSLDMNMGPNVDDFLNTVESLVTSGMLPESRLDESVLRILQLKKDVGLLSQQDGKDNNVAQPPSASTTGVGSADDQRVALALARESVILLENRNQTLPIQLSAGDKDKNLTIFITGPISNNKGYMCGGWSVFWQGSSNSSHFPNGMTFKDAMTKRAAATTTRNIQIEHLDVVGVDGNMSGEDYGKAIDIASRSEYTVVVLGEGNYAEKTGDIADLSLPEGQRKYLHSLTQLPYTKVIVVLITGRPRLLYGSHDDARAVLLSMLPCEQGGEALADILFGDVNPSAKLPITYPLAEGKLLPYFHYVNTKCQPWDECPVEWEFGYGLSYTQFHYSDLKLNATTVDGADGALQVDVTIKNTGSVDGSEVVLLFVSQKYRLAHVPETKLLKKFQKVHLKAQTATQVSFVLDVNDWGFYDPEIGTGFQRRFEAGEFEVSILQSLDEDQKAAAATVARLNTPEDGDDDSDAPMGRDGHRESVSSRPRSQPLKTSSLRATFHVLADNKSREP
ncbi:Lysosomal beta glucosidase, partial [Globisporangium splendens]